MTIHTVSRVLSMQLASMDSVIGVRVGELPHPKVTVPLQLRQHVKVASSMPPVSMGYATPVVTENRLTSCELTVWIARQVVLVTLGSAMLAWVGSSQMLSAQNVSTAKRAWLVQQG